MPNMHRRFACSIISTSSPASSPRILPAKPDDRGRSRGGSSNEPLVSRLRSNRGPRGLGRARPVHIHGRRQGMHVPAGNVDPRGSPRCCPSRGSRPHPSADRSCNPLGHLRGVLTSLGACSPGGERKPALAYLTVTLRAAEMSAPRSRQTQLKGLERVETGLTANSKQSPKADLPLSARRLSPAGRDRRLSWWPQIIGSQSLRRRYSLRRLTICGRQ